MWIRYFVFVSYQRINENIICDEAVGEPPRFSYEGSIAQYFIELQMPMKLSSVRKVCEGKYLSGSPKGLNVVNQDSLML